MLVQMVRHHRRLALCMGLGQMLGIGVQCPLQGPTLQMATLMACHHCRLALHMGLGRMLGIEMQCSPQCRTLQMATQVARQSPAMNHTFNVLGLGHTLDTRSSNAMENPSALRLYRHAKIDPMICKLTGPGDDHGRILPCHEKSATKRGNKEK